MNFEQTDCVLCGKIAEVSFDYDGNDHKNNKYFLCKNKSCGNFEISWMAENRISGNEQKKDNLSEQAKICTSQGKVLKITIKENSLDANCQKT